MTAPPHDPALEANLAGTLTAGRHIGAPPAPDDFYDPRLATIAHAAIEGRSGFVYAWRSYDLPDGELELVLGVNGLIKALENLDAPDPKLWAGLAEHLATVSTSSDGRDVRRLAVLANARRTLQRIEEERSEVLALVENTMPI